MRGPWPQAAVESLWDRQERRLALGHAWWDLAGARPGWRIADVGCGPGRFSLLFADLTGPTGHVHAVDADADHLARLRVRLDPVHHAHVTTEQLDIATTPLPDLRFDLLLLTDVAHHLDDLDAALRNLRLAGAPLLVSEFDADGAGDMGPPLDMRLARAAVQDALRRAGWRPGTVHDLPFEHYGLMARP